MYTEIKKFLSQDIYPFHMPGHKRNGEFLPQNLLELDLTEISGMDVLSAPAPDGIIGKFQAKIAKRYGADRSFFLVNGSSAGIIAAICATVNDGDTLVVPRNAHSSVYNAMVLSGASPMYVDIENMPEGAIVLVVSPTYEGFVSDIAKIAKHVHQKGGLLIVDEAHGAHFNFSDAFPRSAIELGADIVVQSLHKTLPAPSQCALLHVKNNHGSGHTNGKKLDVDRIQFCINMVQTSSPSYMFLAACDFMLDKLWNNPRYFDGYVCRLAQLRKRLPGKNQAALYLQGDEKLGEGGFFDIDHSKLLFTLAPQIVDKQLSCGMVVTGETLAKIMSDQYKVEMEMASKNTILAMTSVADTEEGFLRLEHAVSKINDMLRPIFCTAVHAEYPLKLDFLGNSFKRTKMLPDSETFSCAFFGFRGSLLDTDEHRLLNLPKVALSPRQAMQKPSREVQWEDASGLICAELIAKYPPGIAIVAPGEIMPDGLEKIKDTVKVVDV